MADFLLIHGAGHAAWVWDSVKGILEDNLRKQSSLYHMRYSAGKVLAPDLPGHGEKFYRDDPKNITFETCIEKLLGTIEINNLKYPIIVVEFGDYLMIIPLLFEYMNVSYVS